MNHPHPYTNVHISTHTQPKQIALYGNNCNRTNKQTNERPIGKKYFQRWNWIMLNANAFMGCISKIFGFNCKLIDTFFIIKIGPECEFFIFGEKNSFLSCLNLYLLLADDTNEAKKIREHLFSVRGMLPLFQHTHTSA